MPREVREVRRFAWHHDICDITCGIQSPTSHLQLQNGLSWPDLFHNHRNQFLRTPSQQKPSKTTQVYLRSSLQSTLISSKVTSRTIRIGHSWSLFVLGFEKDFGLGRIRGKRVSRRSTTNPEVVLSMDLRRISSGASSIPRGRRIVSHLHLDENSCPGCTACPYMQFQNPIPPIIVLLQTKALVATLSTV